MPELPEVERAARRLRRAIVGRSIVIVANLQPAKLMGIESNGMILAGSPEGGKPELVAFVDPPPPGSRVR